jgi:hypothetical protein
MRRDEMSVMSICWKRIRINNCSMFKRFNVSYCIIMVINIIQMIMVTLDYCL